MTPDWPGPRLLVPMTVDALVVGTPNQTGTWVDLGVDYASLAVDGSATSLPFATGNPPPVGIHLLWTLPWGLRNGASQPDGSVAFPLVPNRWIVLRSYIPDGGTAPVLTLWVLQSDWLGADGTNPYPDPATPGTYTLIGKAFSLAGWTDVVGTPFLQAVGPGDVSWSAVWQNLDNVLAFSDNPGDAAPGTYTYSVYGWYSPPSADPLLGATPSAPQGWTTQPEWEAILANLGWQVGDGSVAALAEAEQAWQAWQQAHGTPSGSIPAQQLIDPSQSLCHGTIADLPWKGTTFGYPQNIPGGDGVQVAVGNTPGEALAAWLANQIGDPQVEDLIDALTRGQAYTWATDPRALQDSLHADDFTSTGSGLVWVVKRPSQSDPSTGKDAGSQEVDLPAALSADLAALQLAQQGRDAVAAELANQQWQLYSAYYKLQRVDPFDPNLQQQIQAYVDLLVGTTIPGLQGQLTAADAAIAQQSAALGLALDPLGFVAGTVDATPFAAPNDPVVLLAGARSDDRLSRPSSGDTVGTAIPSRYTGQTIASLTVTWNGTPATVTNTAVEAALPLPTATGPIPKELPDLMAETILLDPAASTFLAGLWFEAAGLPTPTPSELAQVAALIAQQQTGIWNSGADPTILADTVGMGGVPPQAYSYLPWVAPWCPVFLDWSLEWHPTSTTPQGALAQWTLGDVDFAWTGTTPQPALATYLGRTLLNTQAPSALASQITAFLATQPNLPAWELQDLADAIADLDGADVVTQSLSGLTASLLMQETTLNGPISDPTVESLVGTASTLAPAPDLQFLPFRSGHALIPRLWVVDAFGQRMPATADGVGVVPIRAEELVTPGAQNAAYVQLAPRIGQSGRLDLELLSATSDAVPSSSDDLSSPIGGYLIPNHLDGSLAVYDAAGNALGALQSIQGDAGAGVRWDNAPGSSDPLGSAPDIANDHLSGVVNGVLKAGLQDIPALSDLLSVLDGLGWQVDPDGVAQDSNLDALAGQPVAVIRASVAFDLAGGPAVDQGWATTGTGQTDGFPQVPLPVRIGDLGFAGNGVLGFFVNDDYATFYPVHGWSAQMGELASARRRGPTALRKAARRSFTDAPTATAGDGYLVADHDLAVPVDGTTVLLTILALPRAVIPGITGSLPVVVRALQPGPTTAAFANLDLSFRVGPLPVDPGHLRMPLPEQINGEWAWVSRPTVTTWATDPSIQPDDAVARLVQRPLVIQEGWLQLSDAYSK